MTDFTDKQIEKDTVTRMLFDETSPKIIFDVLEITQAISLVEKTTGVDLNSSRLLSYIVKKTLDEGQAVHFTGVDLFENMDNELDAGFVENNDIRVAGRVFTQVMRNLYHSLQEMAAMLNLPLESMDFAGKLSEISAFLVCYLEDKAHE